MSVRVNMLLQYPPKYGMFPASSAHHVEIYMENVELKAEHKGAICTRLASEKDAYISQVLCAAHFTHTYLRVARWIITEVWHKRADN